MGLQTQFQSFAKGKLSCNKYTAVKRDTARLNIWFEIFRILFLSVLVSSELMEAASKICFFLSCLQTGLEFPDVGDTATLDDLCLSC